MEITTRKTASATVFDLEGALKMGEPEQSFRDAVEELIESGGQQLVVNLTGVSEIDSSGISALVRAHTSFKRQGGRCIYVGASKRVMQVIKMVRLDTVFEMAESEAKALASF
jgi:anti-anti-sigma factor